MYVCACVLSVFFIGHFYQEVLLNLNRQKTRNNWKDTKGWGRIVKNGWKKVLLKYK